jgi:hypothetical protein
MKDVKDVEIIRDYTKLSEELAKWSKKHNLTLAPFHEIPFVGFWIKGHYRMNQYGILRFVEDLT